jgi:hypothetical protein
VFSDEEQRVFLVELRQTIDLLLRAINAGDYRLVGQVPADDDVATACRDWLASMHGELKIANSPRVS